jgi:diketogulonate reductase-like aldo/keto reductase
MQRREDVAYNAKHGIALMAWGPLARGSRFDNATLKKVASTYSKSPAQTLLRWGLQKARSFGCSSMTS